MMPSGGGPAAHPVGAAPEGGSQQARAGRRVTPEPRLTTALGRRRYFFSTLRSAISFSSFSNSSLRGVSSAFSSSFLPVKYADPAAKRPG